MFNDAGIKLYAVSYDDQEALKAYALGQGIEFTLLSDPESRVIRQYGVLNTFIETKDDFYFGIPFPGTFLLDEEGVIVDKLFRPHLATRDSGEAMIDRMSGRSLHKDDDPFDCSLEEDGIEVSAFYRGGRGQLRIGPMSRLMVRFRMPPGIHVYDKPVPEGMVPVSIDLEAPEGVRWEPGERRPTRSLQIEGIQEALQVWDDEVEFETLIFGNSTLAPLYESDDLPSITITINVRYQACDDQKCFLPQSRKLKLSIPLGKTVIPDFEEFRRASATTVKMDSVGHWQKLSARQKARNPDSTS